MITREDLKEAISECQGKRNPGASDCIKLAAFYTILENMYPEERNTGFSYAAMPNDTVDPIIDYQGDSEFARAVDGRRQSDVLPILDELMDAVSVFNPRLYESVLLRLN